MTTPAFEAFLAKLYTDEAFRNVFLKDPRAATKRFGLTEAECEALSAIDREGLELASESIAAKHKKP